MTFLRTVNLFAETGSVKQTRNRRRTVTHEDAETDILAAVAVNPHISTRQLARSSGISQSSILRILHRHKFHPYHVSLHQELHGDDFQNRVDFCNWAEEQINNNRDFVSTILFSDEASFTNRGQVNRHNLHYWAEENPHWIRQVDHQRPWSVNVWCGVVGDHLIGPYFIDGNLNAEKYSQFLTTDLPVLLEEVPLQIRLAMWYQHDGCPAHFAYAVRDILNRLFPNKWIGRGGPVPWPPRSPDLTAPDFFLWGMLKEKCYADIPTTPDDMKQRIRNACANISRKTLRDVQEAFKRRIRKCLEVNGHHFEHML